MMAYLSQEFFIDPNGTRDLYVQLFSFIYNIEVNLAVFQGLRGPVGPAGDAGVDGEEVS